MNCIEARRMVTPFIKKELSDRETEQFLNHVEHCADCMDELDIHFTVYKALDTLDSGVHHEYDFRRMLNEEIRNARRRILRRKMFRALYWLVLFLTELLLVMSIYTGYQQKRERSEKRQSQEIEAITESEETTESEAQTESKTQTESEIQTESKTRGTQAAQPEILRTKSPENKTDAPAAKEERLPETKTNGYVANEETAEPKSIEE